MACSPARTRASSSTSNTFTRGHVLCLHDEVAGTVGPEHKGASRQGDPLLQPRSCTRRLGVSRRGVRGEGLTVADTDAQPGVRAPG